MEGQLSLFDGSTLFMFDKPIRLIELFAGYGSQHLALSALGVPFESWKICEWAVKSIQAYKDLHFSNDNFDYSTQLSDSQIIDFLAEKGISANYTEPMTKQQIQRLQADKRRVIYNNIFATHNLVNIQQAKGIDLDIKDTDKFTYLLTYSFPCQDLSSVGKRKGMAKDGNTRSGMLWQVERLLKDCNDSLPQMLLMENVPEVVGTKNIHFFADWLSFLDNLGYTSKWVILNAKDFGIPQNRKRCFMLSWLGDYYYDFPEKVQMKSFVDFLDFDEGYIIKPENLTQTQKNYIKIANETLSKTIRSEGLKSRDRHSWSVYSVDLRQSEKFIKNGSLYAENFSKTICAQHLLSYTIDGRVYFDYSPKECFRLMGVTDKQFETIKKNQSKTSLYHLAGDSIVVAVLVAILGQCVEGFDFDKYLNNFYEQIKEQR